MQILDLFSVEDKLWQVLDDYQGGVLTSSAEAKQKISGILSYAKLVSHKSGLRAFVERKLWGELVQLRVSGSSGSAFEKDLKDLWDILPFRRVKTFKWLAATDEHQTHVFYLTARIRNPRILVDGIRALRKYGFDVQTGSFGMTL